MSHLLAIIDAYKDRHGQPSDASVARLMEISPQTLSSWRNRGIRELPDSMDALRKLAQITNLNYEGVVLRAVLCDIGWLTEAEYRQHNGKRPPVAN